MTAEGAPPVRGPRSADPDSRARTHLANERTFLAWLRTGLSLVAIGLAAAQFIAAEIVPGLPIVTAFSALLVICGVGLVVAAGNEYVRTIDRIDAGEFRPPLRLVGFAVGVVVVGGLAALVLVVLLRWA